MELLHSTDMGGTTASVGEKLAAFAMFWLKLLYKRGGWRLAAGIKRSHLSKGDKLKCYHKNGFISCKFRQKKPFYEEMCTKLQNKEASIIVRFTVLHITNEKIC